MAIGSLPYSPTSRDLGPRQYLFPRLPGSRSPPVPLPPPPGISVPASTSSPASWDLGPRQYLFNHLPGSRSPPVPLPPPPGISVPASTSSTTSRDLGPRQYLFGDNSALKTFNQTTPPPHLLPPKEEVLSARRTIKHVGESSRFNEQDSIFRLVAQGPGYFRLSTIELTSLGRPTACPRPPP